MVMARHTAGFRHHITFGRWSELQGNTEMLKRRNAESQTPLFQGSKVQGFKGCELLCRNGNGGMRRRGEQRNPPWFRGAVSCRNARAQPLPAAVARAGTTGDRRHCVAGQRGTKSSRSYFFFLPPFFFAAAFLFFAIKRIPPFCVKSYTPTSSCQRKSGA